MSRTGPATIASRSLRSRRDSANCVADAIAEGVLAVALLAGPEDLRAIIDPHPILRGLVHDPVGLDGTR